VTRRLCIKFVTLTQPDFLSKGADIVTVQHLLDHSDIDTIRRYPSLGNDSSDKLGAACLSRVNFALVCRDLSLGPEVLFFNPADDLLLHEAYV
jgi:hypothetical protein